jgi:hypothetical protein
MRPALGPLPESRPVEFRLAPPAAGVPSTVPVRIAIARAIVAVVVAVAVAVAVDFDVDYAVVVLPPPRRNSVGPNVHRDCGVGISLGCTLPPICPRRRISLYVSVSVPVPIAAAAVVPPRRHRHPVEQPPQAQNKLDDVVPPAPPPRRRVAALLPPVASILLVKLRSGATGGWN